MTEATARDPCRRCTLSPIPSPRGGWATIPDGCQRICTTTVRPTLAHRRCQHPCRRWASPRKGSNAVATAHQDDVSVLTGYGKYALITVVLPHRHSYRLLESQETEESPADFEPHETRIRPIHVKCGLKIPISFHHGQRKRSVGVTVPRRSVESKTPLRPQSHALPLASVPLAL